MTALKTFLLLSVIFLTKNSEGQLPITVATNPSTQDTLYIRGTWVKNVGTVKWMDTMCFPTEVIRKVLIAANEGKEYQKQVGLLTERISLKDQIIEQMNQRDSLVQAGYKNQIAIMQQELDLRKDQMNGYEKLLRKERRKRKAVAGAGITVAGILTYLLISK